jgi:CBS domain containing-hemolysin-like protein
MRTMTIPYPNCVWLLVAGVLATVFFSTAWLLLANLSRGTVRRLEDTNEELANKMERWLDARDELRVAIRVFHVAAAILAVWSMISYLVHLQEINATTASMLVTVLGGFLFYIITTETLGCDLSKTASRILLNAFMPIIVVLSGMIAPLTWPLRLWHRIAKRHREETEEDHERTTTEDEIMSLVEQDEGNEEENHGLDSDERRMIKRIFDLDETLVREIMTPRIDLDALPQESAVDEIQALIVESGHTRIPIYEKSIDHIVGIIHAKDLLNSDLNEGGELHRFLRAPVFIPETKNVAELLAEFRQNNTQFAIVIDEYGGTEGVVTLEDILEEIVGEIHDEYDLAELQVDLPSRLPDDNGGVLVEGRTPIYQLNEEFDFELPEDEDFDTLGGYVSAEIGRIPEAGETIDTDKALIEVIEADQRRIIRAKVTPVNPTSKNGDDSKGSGE